MWNTNFPYWTEGDHTCRVKLWPVAAGERDGFVDRSWETRVPLLAVAADGPAGSLPVTQSGLTVSRKGVLVTAFGRNPDGPGTVLRLWEQAGISGSLSVKLPPGNSFSTASPVNLRGAGTGGALRIIDGGFTFPLGGFAPASFLLQ